MNEAPQPADKTTALHAGDGHTEPMIEDLNDELAAELTLAQLTRRKQSLALPMPVQNPSLLPFNALDPEVFERVVAEVVSRQHNLGVQFYGRRGQKQYGLDIVEREQSQRRSLYQVKRFQEITAAQLREAVETYAGPARSADFAGAKRRFNPGRFVVVTSAELDAETAVVDELANLQDAYAGDLVIEAWGAEALGRILRDAHRLVFAVFGAHWAEAFCGYVPVPPVLQAPNALGLVEEPAEVLGLDALEADAAAKEAQDPVEAGRLYGLVAAGLKQGGFPIHAAAMLRRQARVLLSGGDLSGAFSLLIRLTMEAIAAADRTSSAFVRSDLEQAAARLGPLAQAAATVLSAVDGWYEHGSQLATTVPALETLAAAQDEHAALLCCLVIEQAVVDGLYDWMPSRAVLVATDADSDRLLARLRSLARDANHPDPVVRARLRCAVADAALPLDGKHTELDSTWRPLVTDAAAGRFRAARALVAARAAYACAVRGDTEQAENLWRQAVLASSEEHLYGDARGAMRALLYLAIDEGRPLTGPNGASGGLPDRKRLLAAAQDPALSALEAAHNKRLPDALGDARRYLWEARLAGHLREVVSAQSLLGDVLNSAGHQQAALHFYLDAGQAAKAVDVTRAMPAPAEVIPWLTSPLRQRQAAAIEVIQAQATAVPDTALPALVDQLLERAALIWDAPAADPAPERQALRALAAFGRRIPDTAVDTVVGLARTGTGIPMPDTWAMNAPVIADLLVQIYWALEHRRSGLADILADLLDLPVPPHNLWPLVREMPEEARAPLLDRIRSRAEQGDRSAIWVLARWRQSTPAVQIAPRQACAALLRRPVGIPRQVTRIGTQAPDTVDLLMALFTATDPIDVPTSSLGSDQAQPVGVVLLEMTLNGPAAPAEDTLPTAERPPDAEALPAAEPDQAALMAAGPPADLAAALTEHLLAMAEDTHDAAPSRTQAIDALRALAFRLPAATLSNITDRMLTISRDPQYAAIDLLTLEVSGPLSRGRLNLGIVHLPAMALVLATDAFVRRRTHRSALTKQEAPLIDEVLAMSAPLMRDPDPQVRKMAAVAVTQLAYSAPEAAVHTTGMVFHPDPEVRALAATVVPLTPHLQAALATDPALQVRQALTDRLTHSPARTTTSS